jgi:hypothetical protein
MMPAKCSWNSGSSAVSLEFKFNAFFMYKSSALKSSIQLMRVERNHVPYGNYDNYFLWSTSSYRHNSRNTLHEHLITISMVFLIISILIFIIVSIFVPWQLHRS